jgi:hypothetical protein
MKFKMLKTGVLEVEEEYINKIIVSSLKHVVHKGKKVPLAGELKLAYF